MSDHHEKTDPMAFDTEIVSVTDPDHCPTSKRVDGPKHSWVFDGDDPYVICCYCGQRRDNLTGRIVGETPERADQILRDAGWPMTEVEVEATRGDFERLEAETERLNRSYDDYMRALAESIGVDMEEYRLPSAHGNDRLRWAVLIQWRIGKMQDAERLLEHLRRSLDGPREGIDKAMAEVDAHLWPTSDKGTPDEQAKQP